MNSARPPDQELLVELLLRWEELYERGQDTPATELAKDHPDLIHELARRIKALKTVSWITKPVAEASVPPDTSNSVGATGRMLGGRYRLEDLVAEGGFAEVYRAYDTELQRTVAIKVPKPSRLQSSEAFLAEARRVARLNHDGIVPVHDVGVDGNICFIVSDFLEGGSLADRLAKGKPSTQEAIRWITEIAEALEYAHLHGIVHRDIKPANILIDHHGRAKLTDFGIAQSSMKTGEFAPSLGTLRYMSPEQLEGKPTDHRSDIYSLGLVLYELLTGQLPYSSLEPSVVRREIVEGRVRLLTSLPSSLAPCIRKATSRSPQVRHGSAGEFATELRRTWRPSPTAASRSALLITATILLAVVLTLLLSFQRQTTPPRTEPATADRISLSGLGSAKSLTGMVPAGWSKRGVLADIAMPGSAEFLGVPESAYVMETDLVFHSGRGRISMRLGEPNCNAEISMGDLWPQDLKQDRVTVRLFRGQPFGVNWSGETFLEPHQEISLMLVVADDEQVLFRNGQEVLRARGDPCDLCLRLEAFNNAQATFNCISFRALTKEDARRARVAFPVRRLQCDLDLARERVESQIKENWPRRYLFKSHFVLGDDLVMRWIAPAEFRMGSPEASHPQTGKGLERVRITRGYWIGAYEVTQGQWEDVMGDNPSRITGSPYLPVNNVSWSDARRFCIALTAREQDAKRLPDGYEYRLPTEAEWEYAARAGGDAELVVPINELACRDQKYPHIVEVGTTPANRLGLHEVVGNVAEWVLDGWKEYPNDEESVTTDRFYEGDPARAEFVVRGNGYWYSDLPRTVYVRAGRQDIAGGFRGFRVVLGPKITLRYSATE